MTDENNTGPITIRRAGPDDADTLLELMPGTSKLYSKIQIALTQSGASWGGTGDLYFRSSPERKYQAKIEIPGEDIFSSKSLRVRTICPDAATRTKSADVTATWTKKE